MNGLRASTGKAPFSDTPGDPGSPHLPVMPPSSAGRGRRGFRASRARDSPFVIPGRAESASPEFIITIFAVLRRGDYATYAGVMDSGLAASRRPGMTVVVPRRGFE